jgi:DNA-binding FadR family transcriptional regulator
MNQLLRGPALHEAVRDYIKQYILGHQLGPGDPLPPEGQLAQELGVGRSSVREAVKALQSLGIIEAQHGNGLFVREYNFDPMLEILSYGMRFNHTVLLEFFQIRLWLEGAIIGDAVKQISAKQIAQLEGVLALWKARTHTGQSCADLDKQFHDILYQALRNQTLLKLNEVFWLAYEKLDIKGIHDVNPVEELRDHQAILEAVKNGNPDLARQRLLDNFTHFQTRIARGLELEDG